MSKRRIVHVRLPGTPLPSGTAASSVHMSSCHGRSLPADMWWPCNMHEEEAFTPLKAGFFWSLKQSLAYADYCTSNSSPLWGTQNSSISLHIVGVQLMDGWVDHRMVQSPPESQQWPRELGTHKVRNFFFPQIMLPVRCYSHKGGQSWEGQVSCNPNSGMLYRRKMSPLIKITFFPSSQVTGSSRCRNMGQWLSPGSTRCWEKAAHIEEKQGGRGNFSNLCVCVRAWG